MLLGQDPIQWEKDTLEKMTRLFCRAKHRRQNPCPQCRELITYARQRLDACRYGAQKPPCERCHIHCYKPIMRDRVKQVMRYAGPRMVIYYPLDALRHLVKKNAKV